MKNEDCRIENNILVNKCHSKNKFCFKNKCHSKNKKISNSINIYGDVYILDNNHIIKINREVTKKEYLDSEIKIQEYVAKHGLAPKIYQYYYDPISTNTNTNTRCYIIMENLLEKGYRTLYDLYESPDTKIIPDICLKTLKKAVSKLHKIGIAHKDLHSMNILYNPTKNKIKFIDFGISEKFNTINKAILLEKWNQLMSIKKYIKGSWNKYGFIDMKFTGNFLLSYLLLEELLGSKKQVYAYVNVLESTLKQDPKIVENIRKLINLKTKYNNASSSTRKYLEQEYKKEIQIIKNKKFTYKQYKHLLIYQNDKIK
jgi:serine/threonine protein kinase